MRRDTNLLLFIFRTNLKVRKHINSPNWKAPSTTSTSISTILTSHGTRLVLEPLRQTNADLKSANEVLVLFHEMVLAYLLPFFDNNQLC